MRWLTNDSRSNVIFVCAAVLIVTVAVVEGHFSTSQALWLASMNVPGFVIVTFVICGPWLLGISLLAVLAYWPDIRWYLWRRRQFRHAVGEIRQRERVLFMAGATESAVLATVLPALSDCMYEAARSVFASSSSPELLAYQSVAETYLKRLKRIAECDIEDPASRMASLHAQLGHHRSMLSSFEFLDVDEGFKPVAGRW